MKATPVEAIAGAYLFGPAPHVDERGVFSRTFDGDLLTEQFGKLESRTDQLGADMAQQNARNADRLREQFTILSERLFGRTAGEGER